MAKGLNSVVLGGNLGRDAELSSVPSGQSVSKFSLAVADGFGEKEKTLWFPVVAWGKLAENLNPYLTKGTKVAVRGRLSVREYEKDNVKRIITEVIAEDIWLAGRSADAPQALGRAAPAAAPRRQSRSAAPISEEITEDDIPF